MRHGARYVATPRGDAAAASEAAAFERHGRLGDSAEGSRIIRASQRNSGERRGSDAETRPAGVTRRPAW